MIEDETHGTKHPAFDEFVDTIASLRAPDGCPWDREQTHQSIAKNMLEEAYEAVDAIEEGDISHLQEELGDVLLQVVLQSQIAQDAGEFTIDDVCRDVNEKMIRRHPHVFGKNNQVSASSASEVLDIWDKAKLAEQKEASRRLTAASAEQAENKTGPQVDSHVLQTGFSTKQNISSEDQIDPSVVHQGLLEGIPAAFPALMQAQKVSRKVVSAGFEWETLDDVWKQVFSEVNELKEAYERAPKDAKGKVTVKEEVELEMGDVLFSLVNVARKMGIDAETALRASTRKFRARWSFIEGAAWARGIAVDDLSVDEMEKLWSQAKEHEKKS